MPRRLPPLVVAVAAIAACSSQDSATLQITLGGEATTFTQAPAVTSLVIQSVDTSGDATTLATASLPVSAIDLGSHDEGSVTSFQAFGLDANGDPVVFGATLPFVYGDLAGETVPLFVQRVSQFARLPGPMPDSREAPVLAVVQGEYLFFAGGTQADGGAPPEADGGLAFTPLSTTQTYDFGAFAPWSSSPTLPSLDGGPPFAPRSVAFAGTVGWLIGDQGGLYLDLSSGLAGVIAAPPGGSFADVSGGATVTDTDTGTMYVVGGTRATGAPSAMVLQIDPNDTSNASYPYGNPSWITLSAPRLGASAAWVSGTGLVVAGGSASAAGVEIVPSGATSGTPLAYAPDASVGAGASALGSGDVLLAGGVLPGGVDAGARSIDVGCTSAATCVPQVWSALPVAIGSAQAFTFSTTDALVVGSEPATGLTHAFRLTAPAGDAGAGDAGAGEAAEIALPTNDGPDAGAHVPLRNACAVWSPVGTVVVFGGYDVIDSFHAPVP